MTFSSARGNRQAGGRRGRDILWRPGNDELNGGVGKDTYLYNKGDGEDRILDPDIQTAAVI